jgi:hypothetical protein
VWRSRNRSAAVLGCGPAGIFAAHALIENGWKVVIFSKKRKSHMYGAQYLHSPIPGLTPEGVEPIWVKYQLTGTVEGYREKVYGIQPIHTSVEALQAEHMGWDIRSSYDAGWERYEELVVDTKLTPEFLGSPAADGSNSYLTLDLARFHQVINTVPLPEICYDNHEFHSAKVWAMGDAPDRGQLVPYRPEENVVECNGDRDTGWYRAANVYGWCTMEWPAARKPPLPGVAEVTKPLYSNCDCYQKGELRTKFMNIGRYGSWKKSALTHHAFTQAAQL